MNTLYGKQTKTIDNIKISYTLLPNTRDVTHLVVQLNGYRFGGWDFENAIKSINATILVIDDNLDGTQVCYLGENGNLDFAEATGKLINEVLTELGLTSDDCTLIGASKGGFSALYLGLTHGYRNVIASSFVGYIGTWMHDYNKDIAEKVMGQNYDTKTIAQYDDLLFNAMENHQKQTNIYCAISNRDNFFLQYGQHQILERMNKLKMNCQILYSESETIYGHNGVAVYFLPEVLSLVNLLSRGANINISNDNIGYKHIATLEFPSKRGQRILSDRKRQGSKSKNIPHRSISAISIDGSTLIIEGKAYLGHKDLPTYHHLERALVLKSVPPRTEEYQYPLGAVPSDDLNRKLYNEYFVNYRAAEFATMGKKGIDLSSLEEGYYSLNILIQEPGGKADIGAPDSFPEPIDYRSIKDGYQYRIFEDNGQVILVKNDIISWVKSEKINRYFKITNTWTNRSKFHIEGYFVNRGLKLNHYTSGDFYLAIQEKNTRYKEIFQLGCVKKTGTGKYIKEMTSEYDSAYFATLGLKGIDMGERPNGVYKLTIIQTVGSETAYEDLQLELHWDGTDACLKDADPTEY
ncbi:alpha/beta hydrolase-fold protein [Rothia nasimurium]|uniref:alpha/beta hydrolase-fold protein n=1 Tax=Rothia nasimurium TaxID=85336 RepID=UPI003B9FBE0C